jgi:hypothetical protein
VVSRFLENFKDNSTVRDQHVFEEKITASKQKYKDTLEGFKAATKNAVDTGDYVDEEIFLEQLESEKLELKGLQDSLQFTR